MAELRQTPLLALLIFVPLILTAERLSPDAAHCCSCFRLLRSSLWLHYSSRATEAVAAETGDAIGGLLNATLGNFTELAISLAALQAGQYLLVKASAGAIVTNSLLMLGGSFLLGVFAIVQEFNRVNARFQPLPAIPGDCGCSRAFGDQRCRSGVTRCCLSRTEPRSGNTPHRRLCDGNALFLKTHREPPASVGNAEEAHGPWPLSVSIVILVVVTVFVALFSEIFVGSVQVAAARLGMTPAFVGFIVVALVGGAAENAACLIARRAATQPVIQLGDAGVESGEIVMIGSGPGR